VLTVSRLGGSLELIHVGKLIGHIADLSWRVLDHLVDVIKVTTAGTIVTIL
jgi:hypothetical protein